jgi:hypothetical protein
MANITNTSATLPPMTVQDLEELMTFFENKSYIAPYHEEPVNDFVDKLRAGYGEDYIDFITHYLPYMIVDLVRDEFPDRQDEIEPAFREWAKESVENILTFEMNEY